MKYARLFVFWPVLAWFLFLPRLAPAATNNSLSDEALLQITFDQKTNALVSSDLAFTDEAGQPVHLGDYLGSKPIVLMLGYYKCPMLCTLVLNGATESFRNLKWSVGRQFDVIFVSIDPQETHALAAAKKAAIVRYYHRPGTEAGWHFLTGQAAAIQTLARQIGFHFAYDPQLKQFAHPSGLVVLTPDGRISRYFFGVTFSASDVDLALHAAAAKKIGSPVEQFVLLCFHYSPFTGKYGQLVMETVRVSGVVMVVALGAFILVPRRGGKKEGRK
jgi:protein SCO1/2